MKFEYCAAIRTLGTAGDKYYQTLLSLKQQTIPPKKILVYIAEGYPLPKETIGIEQYVYVKKGMIAQRALPYKEVDTEYILLLDDDLAFPSSMVEKLFGEMQKCDADVISPNVFPNHNMTVLQKLYSIFFVGTFPMKSDKYAFKIRKNGCYSYNNNPKKDVYLSQSAAGSCSLWKLNSFRSIHFEDEIYFDRFRYPLGEDQLLFYKAYLNGYKLLVDYNTGIQHLDGKAEHQTINKQKLIDDTAILLLIWHRTCYQKEGVKCIPPILRKIFIMLCARLVLIIPQGITPLACCVKGLAVGMKISKSQQYRSLHTFVLR
ncbi:MAG: glycosyltransferase [Muribaculaceae bacterium]|nr:glycosyltransferase [Muribaculaceae bacterium]